MIDNSNSNNCKIGLTVAAWDEKLNEWNTNGKVISIPISVLLYISSHSLHCSKA